MSVKTFNQYLLCHALLTLPCRYSNPFIGVEVTHTQTRIEGLNRRYLDDRGKIEAQVPFFL